MPHVRLDFMQKTAREHGFAVPHFIGGNIEMILGAIRAAEDQKSPLALGFAPEVFPFIPLEIIFPLLANAARMARIPVATQLEHGKDEATIEKVMRLGASSVMFDGSGLPYEENIKRSAHISALSHSMGIAAEAELGSVGGAATATVTKAEGFMTDPNLVADFVNRTGIDTLAISFGNVHGPYRGEPRLDFGRVTEIAKATCVPLVMHGGSGLGAKEYAQCIEAGISNIHFYHGIAVKAYGHMLENLKSHDSPLYSDMSKDAVDFFYKKSIEVFAMLGSIGKAGLFSDLANKGPWEPTDTFSFPPA